MISFGSATILKMSTFSRVVEYKYAQPLVGTLEILPETGVLANHSSDFSLSKPTTSQPASWSDKDLFMEVVPQPKNTLMRNTWPLN